MWSTSNLTILKEPIRGSVPRIESTVIPYSIQIIGSVVLIKTGRTKTSVGYLLSVEITFIGYRGTSDTVGGVSRASDLGVTTLIVLPNSVDGEGDGTGRVVCQDVLSTLYRTVIS